MKVRDGHFTGERSPAIAAFETGTYSAKAAPRQSSKIVRAPFGPPPRVGRIATDGDVGVAVQRRPSSYRKRMLGDGIVSPVAADRKNRARWAGIGARRSMMRMPPSAGKDP
ncbi:hypothetical protein CHELA40_14600 [Chelatococcus asaccharovorans]|nr:hypothetical protein CHELA17_61020 [Chelatococcus asaccharovorans]CAH1678665.1 hypothetical protein CHELA40_14600 [Chelatococcus asaccharovorans]